MEAQQIFDAVNQRHAEAIAAPLSSENTKDPYFKVKPEHWLAVAQFLRDTPELGFDYLNCVTAVDWIKQNVLQVVYHLYSYRHHHSIVVKVDADRAKPLVPSVVPVWSTANWQEREQYDLLGVEFTGHPDLRRLLMPDDWAGHPMRKDYKEATHYRDMPTSRPSVLDLLGAYDKAQAAAAKNGGQP
jgi:NADH-quinone oxidoreductase subunit C